MFSSCQKMQLVSALVRKEVIPNTQVVMPTLIFPGLLSYYDLPLLIKTSQTPLPPYCGWGCIWTFKPRHWGYMLQIRNSLKYINPNIYSPNPKQCCIFLSTSLFCSVKGHRDSIIPKPFLHGAIFQFLLLCYFLSFPNLLLQSLLLHWPTCCFFTIHNHCPAIGPWDGWVRR